MKRTIVVLLATSLVPAVAAADTPASPLDSKISEQISQGSGLTADQVVSRTKTTSPQLRGESEKVRAASAAVDQASAGYVPKLQATARYTRLSPLEQNSFGNLVATSPNVPAGPIPPGTPLINVPLKFPVLLNNTSFQLALTIPISDYFLRVPQFVGAAKSSERAAEANQEATDHNVDVDARQAYYNWVRARLQLIVADASLEQARGHLADVQKAAQVGTASRADVLRVESSVAQADLVRVRALNAAELTQEQLRTLMHDPTNQPYTLGEDVRLDLPPVVADESLEGLLRQAETHRPELRGLSESTEAARKQGKALTAAYLPRVDLFGDVYYQNPNQRIQPSEDKFTATWDVGVQLTWVISDIPGTAAQKAQNAAQVAQLEASRAQTSDAIRVEILSALQGVKEARASIVTTASGLTTAEEAYRVRRVLFQNGRATSLELTDAELDLTNARLNSINARVDLRVARAKLLKAIGQ
jgi:outer membrane protein TolC